MKLGAVVAVLCAGHAISGAALAQEVLTPAEALEATITRNPRMIEAGLAMQEAELDRAAQDGLRPWTFGAEGGFRFDEQPTAGVFETGVRRTSTYQAKAEVLKQFLPGTSLSARLDWNRSRSEIPFTVPDLGISDVRTIGPNYFTGATISVNQPLMRGFGSELGRLPAAAADQAVDLARAQRSRLANDLVAEALDTYWRWIGAQLELESRRNSLARTRVLADATVAQIDAGQLAELERDIVEQRIAAAEQGILAAESAVEDSADTLRRVMGLELDDASRWARPGALPGDAAALPELADVLEGARAANPELILAKQDVDAARLALVRSRDATRPQLDAVANLSQLGLSEAPFESLEQVGTLDFTTLFLGIVFRIPLDNGLAIQTLAADEIALQRAEMRYMEATREVALRARQALRLLDTQRKRLMLSEREIELARKNLSAMQDKFGAGLASYLEVLQLEEDLSGAEQRYLQARLDVITARTGIQRLMGTLLPAWGVELR